MTLRPGISVEDLNRRGAGYLPARFGFRVMAIEQGMLVAEMEVRREHLAPNGFLHAAAVVALADTACGYGCIAHLPHGAESFTTIELKTNFLGTARAGTLACVARPAHMGKATQVWDAVVSRHGEDKSIALFRCTQMILWPQAR